MTEPENTAVRELVHGFSLVAREKAKADHSTIWVLDYSSKELWTVIPERNGSLLELRIQVGLGYVGLVAETGELLNIPFDLYEYKDSRVTQQSDRQIGYRTCSLLCVPIFSPNREIVGVIQLINKRSNHQFTPYNPANWPQAPDCFKASFDTKDQESMIELSSEIGIALQNAGRHSEDSDKP